eukprot:scaffold1357_cov97-Isochrysis_galbana.AAC.2
MERYKELKPLGKGSFGQVFLVAERSGLRCATPLPVRRTILPRRLCTPAANSQLSPATRPHLACARQISPTQSSRITRAPARASPTGGSG